MYCLVSVSLNSYYELSQIRFYGGFELEEDVNQFIKLKQESDSGLSGETVYYRICLEKVAKEAKGKLHSPSVMYSYNLAPRSELVWQDIRYDLG